MQALTQRLAMRPEDRRFGGRTGSALWLVGGPVFALFPLLLGHIDTHPLLTELIAAGAFGWGLYGTLICPWDRVDPLISPISALIGFLMIALGAYLSGGSRSPIWVCYYWAVPVSAFFYPRPFGVLLTALAIGCQLLPLLYDPAATQHGYVAISMAASVGYGVVGWSVLAGKEFYDRLRLRTETFAAEQVALRRAASAVMRGEERERIYGLVTEEAAKLIGCDLAGIFQAVGPQQVRLLSSWALNGQQTPPLGSLMPIVPGGPIARAIERRGAARGAGLDQQAGTIGYMVGFVSSIVAPVIVGDSIWGVIGLGAHRDAAFDRFDERRIEAFAEMLANIITSLEERARLESDALTDQLTGLPNHRALHQRLAAELAGAGRHGRQLAIAMIDLDNFKEINDLGGHDRGDEALRRVAMALDTVSRTGDTVGRLGGDEFMWILPDTDSHQALGAIERARELIGQNQINGRRLTTSAGVCDTSSTSDPAELVRRADIALYASKASGRDQATLYDTEVAAALEPGARGAWIERSQSLAGLRALARAVDAKDPATSEHSERVASFAGRLAQVSGWPDDRIARLREAALVHDVGKLAVPDALLTKPGQLTERERLQINEHVELSVRIVGNILSNEQVSWIHAHHERPDGRGYPRSLGAAEIPEGAALISLADAWDVMVAGRTYNRRKSLREAYAECLELEGRQFLPVAVRALRELHAAGWLGLDAGPQPAATASAEQTLARAGG